MKLQPLENQLKKYAAITKEDAQQLQVVEWMFEVLDIDKYMNVPEIKTICKTLSYYKVERDTAVSLIVEAVELDTVNKKSGWLEGNKHYDLAVCKSIGDAIKETFEWKWLKVEDEDLSLGMMAVRNHLPILRKKFREMFRTITSEVIEETGGFLKKNKRLIGDVMAVVPYLDGGNWLAVDVAFTSVKPDLKRFTEGEIFDEWKKKMSGKYVQRLEHAKLMRETLEDVLKEFRADLGGIKLIRAYIKKKHSDIGEILNRGNKSNYLSILEKHSKIIYFNKSYIAIIEKEGTALQKRDIKEIFSITFMRELYDMLVPDCMKVAMMRSNLTLAEGRISEDTKGEDIYKGLENFVNKELKSVKEYIHMFGNKEHKNRQSLPSEEMQANLNTGNSSQMEEKNPETSGSKPRNNTKIKTSFNTSEANQGDHTTLKEIDVKYASKTGEAMKDILKIKCLEKRFEKGNLTEYNKEDEITMAEIKTIIKTTPRQKFFKSRRIIRKSIRNIKEKGVAGKEFNRKEYVEPKDNAKQQGKSEENDKQK